MHRMKSFLSSSVVKMVLLIDLFIKTMPASLLFCQKPFLSYYNFKKKLKIFKTHFSGYIWLQNIPVNTF